ncbi:ketopantoate reductase family protein [Bdellovibrionota bacterium]
MANILVIGAGAVGGFFGGKLAKAGHDVTFFVRERHRNTIRDHGLQIKSVEGDFTICPRVATSVKEIEIPDIILLATKCYDALSAIESIKEKIGPDTILLTLLNGLGVEEKIKKIYGDIVLPGTVVITSRLDSPGVIEHFANGFISVGEFNSLESDRLRTVVDLLKSAEIKTSVTKNVAQAKWKKLCWNATFNPLSVIADRPVKVILSSPKFLRLIAGTIEEIRKVAAAEGVELSRDIAKQTIEMSSPLGDYYTSMWEDFQAGKASEVEFFNGEIIRRAEKKGLKVPYNQALLALTELRFEKR